MKLTINRDTLLTPLQQIVGVIEKRQTMAILANILFTVQNSFLTLTGTDLEIQLVARIGISTSEDGSCTVPARKLLDLCRMLPNKADIEMVFNEDKCKIISGRSRFSLSCLPASHYPEFAESAMDKHITLKAGKLKKALEKTLFCMANQDVRYYLNGLLLTISNKTLKLVASDGHRLAIFEDVLDESTGFETRMILPRKGVLELYRLLEDPETNLKILFSNSNIKIEINDLCFSAKLVDAKYPDFSRVFDQAFYDPISLPKQAFKDTIARVAILANEKFKGVSLDISPANLKVFAHNPEHDEAEEELELDYHGEVLSIAFNAQYLVDAVANIEAETVLLTIASNASSCFIDEPQQSTYKFIVMPMRI